MRRIAGLVDTMSMMALGTVLLLCTAAQAQPASAPETSASDVPASSSPAPAAAQAPASAVVAAASCPVQVYRLSTSYNRANPELPYIYADDQKVSRLGVGKTVCVKLTPGKHTVSMREPLAFMPGFTSGTVELEVVEGKALYVRYAKEFGGIAATGSGTTMTSKNSLRLATEEEWKTRQ